MSLSRRASPPRSRAFAALLAVAAPCAALATSANTVFAQTAPQVTSKISENEVEVGEAFTIELMAMSETNEVLSEPDLRVPAGFSVSGPMISQQSYFQFGTGGRKSYRGVGATWSLVASAPGSFNIPAPTIVWNGQKLRGSPATIKVLPQGSRPQKQQGGFLFPGGGPPGFGSGWPFGGGGFEPDEDQDQPGDDPALSLPRAPNEDIFLHAIADKKTAVVGEQVTVSVYVYFRIEARIRESSPMRMQDFLRYSLVKDAGASQTTTSARAGNHRYRVRLLEKFALFPLRTGKLSTGSMVETYVGPDGRRPLKRASEDIVVQVTEPPSANRPVGFRQGDVGQFQISALVQPRRVEEGGSVAVTVRVTGAGNFPTNLAIPERTGIEWLEPEKKESIEPRNGEVAGFRSFGYVVRLTNKGTVDLGTIELPHWNPRARRYEVARTVLGTVEVTPGANSKASPAPSASASAAADSDDPWRNLPPPRTTLSEFKAPPEATLLLEGPRFVGALVAPPFLALAGIAGASLSRRVRSRLAGRRTSPRTLAAAALDDARRAKKAGDERAAAAAVERAIVLAIEGATGLKARGVLKESLASELTAKGVPEKVAARASEALAACDAARFDPLAAAGVRVEDGETLVSDLLATKAP